MAGATRVKALVTPTGLLAARQQVKPVQKNSSKDTSDKVILNILPNADCTIYIDGKSRGDVLAGKVLRIPLAKGTYDIKATGADNNQFDQVYTVKTASTETLLKISLQSPATVKRPAVGKQNNDDLNPQMIYVQGGSFVMGSNNDGDDAKPLHRVTLSNFYIGKYEVSQAQWIAVMGNNPSSFQDCDNCPVEQVSWYDVQDFIQKLNQKTGKNYRLPTEAEWEYAARGGNKGNGYPYSGSSDINSVGWYSDNSNGKTEPVGEKQANELGIYDMTGNVWEWCSDWYSDSYYKKSPAVNPQGPPSGPGRLRRGGGRGDAARACRVAYRVLSAPGFRSSSIGFRLVLAP